MDFIFDLFGVEATDILEIYSVGGGEYLYLLFTGVRDIMNTSTFNVLLAIIALTGFLALLAMGALDPKRFNYTWIFVLCAIYYGAVVPRTDIVLVDTIRPDAAKVVTNVPLIMALPAAFFSRVSLWFTREIETRFTVLTPFPEAYAELAYSNNGFLMGHAIIAEMNSMRFPDERVRQNFAEFWKTCVFYDIALGLYSWKNVVNASKNNGAGIINFFSGETSIIRSFPYKAESGDQVLIVCREGWNGVMATDLREQTIKMYKAKHYKSFPWEIDTTNAKYFDDELNAYIGSYASSMPAALSFYAHVSQGAAAAANTAILGNSLRDGLGNLSGEMDIQAATEEYAFSKAQLERQNSFAVMGRIANKFLPMLKNIFEALIYAMTPVMVMMLMLPSAGKAIIGYLKVLIWINLWNPFYAILHSMISFYSSSAAQGLTIAEDPNSGVLINSLSFVNYTQYAEVMSEHAVLAGYLALSIPMMAWMVVSMSGAMMAGLAGRTMQGYDGSVQRASNEIVSGNVNMGNMSYGNSSIMQEQLSPKTDSHRVEWTDPTNGMTHRMDAGGHLTHEQGVSKLGASLDHTGAMSRATKTALDHAESAQRTATSSLTDGTSAVLSEARAIESSLAEKGRLDDVFATSEGVAYTEASGSVSQMMTGFLKQQGWSDNRVASAEASAGGNLVLGAKTAMGSSEGRGTEFRELENFTSGSSFQSALSALRTATHNLQSSLSKEYGDVSTEGLSSALATTTRQENAVQVATGRVDTARSQVEEAESLASGMKIAGTDGFLRFLEDNDIMSRNSALSMVDKVVNRNADPASAEAQQLNSLMTSYASSYLEGHAGAAQGMSGFAATVGAVGAANAVEATGFGAHVNAAKTGNDLSVEMETDRRLDGLTREGLQGEIGKNKADVEHAIANPESKRPEAALLGDGGGGGARAAALKKEVNDALKNAPSVGNVVAETGGDLVNQVSQAGDVVKDVVKKELEEINQNLKETDKRFVGFMEDHGIPVTKLRKWAGTDKD